jgi:ABC-type transport system involved in multi-copper enzyme maturation permease subunit
MTAVLVVELRRALSRRLVRMLVLVALVGIVAIAIGAWVTSDADSPTAYSAADIWSGVDDSGDANTLGSTSALFLFMGLLGGASFIGAEYRAGTIGTLLTWEPRRLRVIAAKLIAAGVVAGLLYLVLQAVLAAALVGVASGAGTTDGVDADFYVRLGGLLVRGALLTAGCAILGGSLAALGRNTTAALGIVLGYLLVVENILRGLRPGWDEWLVIDNLFLVLVGRPEDSADLQRSVLGAGILLVAYLAVLVSGTAAVFARRDVT